eukprot:2301369-Prymnesium_polylepis.1
MPASANSAAVIHSGGRPSADVAHRREQLVARQHARPAAVGTPALRALAKSPGSRKLRALAK